MEELKRFPLLVNDATPVVIGSREGLGAQRFEEPRYRHVMGRVFNLVVQWLLVPGIGDTQCGFKAFQADAARAIFERAQIVRFAFDVEVLFVARQLGYGIRVVPLRWEHDNNSHVGLMTDTARMLSDVLRVRLNGWRRTYVTAKLLNNSPGVGLTPSQKLTHSGDPKLP